MGLNIGLVYLIQNSLTTAITGIKWVVLNVYIRFSLVLVW